MAHSVKIEDKLYEKVGAYCRMNGISITKLCNDAIEEHLNMLKYGDAPFLIASNMIDERHMAEEAAKELEKKYHDENGQLVVTPISTEDAEKELTRILMENQDPPLTEEQKKFIQEETENIKDFIETPQPVVTRRPGKRRL